MMSNDYFIVLYTCTIWFFIVEEIVMNNNMDLAFAS